MSATIQRHCFAYGFFLIPRRFTAFSVCMWRVLAVFMIVNKYSKHGEFVCKAANQTHKGVYYETTPFTRQHKQTAVFQLCILPICH